MKEQFELSTFFAIEAQCQVRYYTQVAYSVMYQAMKDFTELRTANTVDEIWFTEHAPVFTQGLAGKPEHVLVTDNEMPVIQTDRGGQVTYHGPGQLIVYVLIDIRRRHMDSRQLVDVLEKSIVETLATLGIQAFARAEAPGVYVAGDDHHLKIASLGLRIRRGCSYHGAALNVSMNLQPFTMINPCGQIGLQMADLHRLGIKQSLAEIRQLWVTRILDGLSNYSY